MPLIQGSSESALRENIATEIRHGKSPEQAAAIGYSVQRANDDEYVPSAVPVLPEGMSAASINEANRRYWKSAGGEQS